MRCQAVQVQVSSVRAAQRGSGPLAGRLSEAGAVMDLSREACAHPGILPLTHELQTHTEADTKSILQRVLFNNALGRVEGCHLEKIGFHLTERRTGAGCLQRHITTGCLGMKFTRSLSLITV